MEHSAHNPTVNWRRTPQGVALHSYPQASGAGEKSLPGGEPEEWPLMASLPLGCKMNFHIPIYGPPCIIQPRMHSSSKSRQLSHGWKSSLWDGGGARGRAAEPPNSGPESLWWIHKAGPYRQPLFLSQGLDLGSGETLMVAPGKIKTAEQQLRHHEIKTVSVVLARPP